MGFFDTGYQPTEKDKWQMKQREERDRTTRAAADDREANRLRQQMVRDEMKADADRQKMAQSIRAQAQRDAAAEERAILTQSIIRRVGGTDDIPGGVLVWHWRCEPPTGVVLKQQKKGAGFLLRLPRGGGVSGSDTVLAFVDRSRPQWIEDNPEWVATVTAAIGEVKVRYINLLRQLRDDREMGRLFFAAGVTMDRTVDEQMVGTYGTYTRRVTERSVPSLTDVMIGVEGLELTYAHRPGDSAKRWSGKIDTLRSAFAARGVDSSRLRVVDGDDGSIRLGFDDAPTVFPSVVAPEPATDVISSVEDAIAARKRARWLIGVDARGNAIAPKIDASAPHALIVAGTGGGKSVFCRSLIESLRVGTSSHSGGAQAWQFVIADGKRTDFRTLLGQPGVLMVSNEAAQHVVAVHRVWTEMHARFKTAEQRKDSGIPHDQAFRFPPLMLLADEFAIMRAAVARLGKASDEFFCEMIEELLRLAREVSIVVVISSQDIRVDTIDGAWQENLKLVISLGQPSKRTLMSDAFGDDDTKAAVTRIGSRITAPGRGVIVQKSDDGSSVVREFQSYMGWSPGSTDIAAAPNGELAAAWQRAASAAERVPRLYPRLGIEVGGPEWREGEAEVIANTAKVVVLDGIDGPLPERITADPSSPKWLGRQPESTVLGGHEEITFAAPATATPSRPIVVDTEPEPVNGDDDLLAALAEAQRRGLIPKPDQDEQSPQRGGGSF